MFENEGSKYILDTPIQNNFLNMESAFLELIKRTKEQTKTCRGTSCDVMHYTKGKNIYYPIVITIKITNDVFCWIRNCTEAKGPCRGLSI